MIKFHQEKRKSVSIRDIKPGQIGIINSTGTYDGIIVLKVNENFCASLNSKDTWSCADFDVELLDNGTLLEICNND